MKKLAIAGMIVVMAAHAVASDVYSFDIRFAGGRFVKWDTNNPAGLTQLGTGTGTTWRGMDFNVNGTTLYAVKNTAAGVNVIDTINLANGATLSSVTITGVGAADNATDLHIDSTGQAWFSAFGTTSQLYKVNLNTGAATFQCTMGTTSNLIVDLASGWGGPMIGHDIGTDTMFTVNTSSGVLTALGPTGLAGNFAQGMDFDWSTNQLYAAIYTGGGTLTYGTVSQVNGSITSIPGLPSGEYEMAVRAVPEPATMAVLGLGAAALLRRRRKV